MPRKRRTEFDDVLHVPIEPLPRKRQKKEANPHESEQRTFKTLFTLQEKQQLLAGLRRYDKDDVKNIQKLIPTRTQKEVKWFIELISERKLAGDDIPLTTPIELWLHTSEDLTHHADDHSCVLSRVMSVAGNLEPHDSNPGHENPDYGAIYRYIAALLRGNQPPSLSRLDAAVVVDLLHNLASHLRSLDISDHCKMMLTKYELLHMKVDIRDRDKAYEATRRALEEDLLQDGITDFDSEWCPWVRKKGRRVGQKKVKMHGQSTETANSSTEQPGPANSSTEQPGPANSSKEKRGPSNTETTNSSTEQPGPANSSTEKPGPSNTETTNSSTEQPGPSNQNGDIGVDADLRNEDILGGKAVASERILNKDHRPGKHGKVEYRPKKTRLYSLNPFCIPVKYLKPKQKSGT